MDAKSFGVFIADQRRTLGLTQAEVAARLHVTDKAVSRWERGVGLPDINTLEPLAQVLHLTLDELIHTGTSGTGNGADSVKTFVDLFSPQSRYAGQLLRAVCLLLSILFCLAGLLLCPGQPCNFVGCRRTDRPCFLRRKVLYLSYCGIAAMSGVIFLVLL